MNEMLCRQIEQATKALLKGEVVAFPTETVMGLGVIYDDYNAYLKMNEIKRRREDKPYTLMLKDIDEITKYAYVDERVNKVINHFMPGSLTILLISKDNVPGYVTHDTGIIGIRVPTNIEAKFLLQKVNKPLLVPSANKAGEKPALSSEEVIKIFPDELGFIIAGISKGEKPSTIVDFTKEEPILVREGPISFEEILDIYHG
ncbi:MAG: threonylcarbamoyl-AMP synthase [Bacilli bacterium]|nr:threonylcarbamoyl-AMP synthase [Bacilli bacterium]